jgi:hypothetical protein
MFVLNRHKETVHAFVVVGRGRSHYHGSLIVLSTERNDVAVDKVTG